MFEGDGKDELVPNLTEFSVEVPLEADVTEVRASRRLAARTPEYVVLTTSKRIASIRRPFGLMELPPRARAAESGQTDRGKLRVDNVCVLRVFHGGRAGT